MPKDIRISTEHVEGHKGDMVKVSSIEIFLTKEAAEGE